MYTYLLQPRSVFLKDLKAFPLKCSHQEGQGLYVLVPVGGQDPNFVTASQQMQLG